MESLTARLGRFLPYLTGRQENKSRALPGVSSAPFLKLSLREGTCDHCWNGRRVATLPCGHQLCRFCVNKQADSFSNEDITCPCGEATIPRRVRISAFSGRLSVSEEGLSSALLQVATSTDEDERSKALSRARTIVECKGNKIDYSILNFSLDRNHNPVTLLHLAIFSNDTKLVASILEHQNLLTLAGYKDVLPWFYRNHPKGESEGADSDILPMIKLLVQHGAKDHEYQASDLFWMTLRAGDTKTLRYLIEAEATDKFDPSDVSNICFVTHSEMLELLIEKGIRCVAFGSRHNPLHLTVKNKDNPLRINMIKTFIKYQKGDFLGIDHNGKTILDLAIQQHDEELIRLLFTQYSPQQWLGASQCDTSPHKLKVLAHCIEERFSTDIVQSFIDGWKAVPGHTVGSLAHLPYEAGEGSILELACRVGNVDAIEMLTGYGCSLFTANAGRRAPIDTLIVSRLAVSENETIAFFKWLTEKGYLTGSNISRPVDEQQNTLLSLAAQKGYKRAVSHLIASGADPEIINSDGKKPGDYVSHVIRRDIKILLENPNWAFLQPDPSRKRPSPTLESVPAPKRTKESCVIM